DFLRLHRRLLPTPPLPHIGSCGRSRLRRRRPPVPPSTTTWAPPPCHSRTGVSAGSCGRRHAATYRDSLSVRRVARLLHGRPVCRPQRRSRRPVRPHPLPPSSKVALPPPRDPGEHDGRRGCGSSG
ncbi:Os08g0137600, partial [Oryza sativa Japonica Group]